MSLPNAPRRCAELTMSAGNVVDPKIASQEAKAAFRANPVSASLSGLGPRMGGGGVKRVPKVGILLAFSFVVDDGDIPGVISATGAS